MKTRKNTKNTKHIQRTKSKRKYKLKKIKGGYESRPSFLHQQSISNDVDVCEYKEQLENKLKNKEWTHLAILKNRHDLKAQLEYKRDPTNIKSNQSKSFTGFFKKLFGILSPEEQEIKTWTQEKINACNRSMFL